MSKYKRGDKITSLDELYSQEFVYFRHKVTHMGWFYGWALRFCAMSINAGNVYKAIRKGNENE